jgi:hypothetical protein
MNIIIIYQNSKLYINKIILFFFKNSLRIGNILTTNLAAINITTLHYSSTLNQRFLKFFQSPFEFVWEIALSSYENTIYVLTYTYQSPNRLYFQHNQSDFNLLATGIQSFDLFNYYPAYFGSISITFITLGVLLFLCMIIVFSIFVYLRKKKRIHYIQLPEFNFESQNKYEIIMNDRTVPKIDANKLVLGDTIGLGGQALIRKAEYKGK